MSTAHAPAPSARTVAEVGLEPLVLAQARALESEREDALLHDPWAAAFVARAGLDLPAALARADLSVRVLWQITCDYLAVRTRHLDALVLAGAARAPQVVLLGAGLDVRALRLHWPAGVVVHELDRPGVLAFKDEALAAAPEPRGAHTPRRVLPVDLGSRWTEALAAGGHDPTRPTTWVAEGLLPHLTAPEVDRLVRGIDGRSAPGSQVVLDDLCRPHQGLDPVLAELAPDLPLPAATGCCAADPLRLLGALGWQVETERAPRVARRYRRPLEERGRAAPLAASRFALAVLPG